MEKRLTGLTISHSQASIRAIPLMILALAYGATLFSSTRAEDPAPRTELATEVALAVDLCASTARHGIDFPLVVNESLQGSATAINLLFWVGENVPLDAAASEGYSFYLLEVLKRIGDRRAATILQDAKAQPYVRIRNFLRSEYTESESENPEGIDSALSKDFPSLWALINSR